MARATTKLVSHFGANGAGAKRAGLHSWSEKHRFERHSDQACFYCGLTKRTRHEGGEHWVEFVDSGVVVARPGSPMPKCPGPQEHQFTEPKEETDASNYRHSA